MAEVFWSDIGESLGLSMPDIRRISARFGGILGISSLNRVPKSSLGAVSTIAAMQRQGVPDDEIEEALLSSKTDSGWPDEVLNRMQEQAATLAAVVETVEGGHFEPAEDHHRMDNLPDSFEWMGCLSKISRSQEHEAVSPVKDMILDLRREICSSTISEREQIQRLTQVIEVLIREVRDLRYALIMASSRKDRKKGLRGLSRLLTR